MYALGDLGDTGEEVLQSNVEQAWRHRELWSQVLPVAFDAVWEVLKPPFDDGGVDIDSFPAEWLLLPEVTAVDYTDLGDGLLERLLQWCTASPDGFAVQVVERTGGAGKTRLGIEVCRRLRERGWATGFLRADRDSKDLSPVLEARVPRLVVVDYAEEGDTAVLAGQLQSLRSSSDALWPVRVMLLGRPRAAGGLAGRMRSLGAPALGVLRHVSEDEGQSSGLDPVSARALYEAAVRGFRKHPKAHPDDLRAVEPVWQQDVTALDVLAVAYVRVFSGQDTQVGAALGKVSEHEQRRWADLAPGLTNLQRRYAVALLTLAGADGPREERLLADELAAEGIGEDAWTGVRQWLAGLTPGDGLSPLRPDLLGELLVGEVLREAPEKLSAAVSRLLASGSGTQMERALEVLLRGWAAGDDIYRQAVDQALTAALPHLVQRFSGTLPDGAYTLIGQAATLLVADGFVAESDRRLVWAAVLSVAGETALSRGLYEAAETAAATALPLTDNLPDDRLTPTVTSAALTLAGDAARNRGDWEVAGRWYEKAREIYEELEAQFGERDPQDRRGTAVIYERLGDVARNRGDWEVAGRWYEKAREIYEELEAQFVERDLQDRRGTAVIYERLGDVARNRGDWEVACGWYEKAREIYEELEGQFVERDLQDRRGTAVIYERLGDVARNRGDWEVAGGWYEKALETGRGDLPEGEDSFLLSALALAKRFAEQSRQAVIYTRLGEVAQNREDSKGACGWYEKAREIYESLAAQFGERDPQEGEDSFLLSALELAKRFAEQSRQGVIYTALVNQAQAEEQWEFACGWYQKMLVAYEGLAGDSAPPANWTKMRLQRSPNNEQLL